MSDFVNIIYFPTPPLYWIAWTDETASDVKGYGFTSSDEQTTSYKFPMTTYLDESVWKSVLLQHGIDPDPDEEEE